MNKEEGHKIFVLPPNLLVNVVKGKEMFSHPLLVNNEKPKSSQYELTPVHKTFRELKTNIT